MAHIRTQIREGVVTAITGLPTTGASVSSSRVYEWQDADLPVWCVYAEGESSEPQTIHLPRLMDRKVSIVVEGTARANADLDNTLDQMSLEVEVAMAYPVAALEGIAKSTTLTNTQIQMTGTAQKPTGQIRLTYAIEYFAVENAPDVAL